MHATATLIKRAVESSNLSSQSVPLHKVNKLERLYGASLSSVSSIAPSYSSRLLVSGIIRNVQQWSQSEQCVPSEIDSIQCRNIAWLISVRIAHSSRP
jgi:hypothetical protein